MAGRSLGSPTVSEVEPDGDGDVLVVGAGPVGTSAALALDARGVPVTILEAESADRDRPGSRADYVHGATLEILEAVHPGLGKRIADAGLIPPTRRTLWRGREVYSRTYSNPGGSGYLPHSTRIPQTEVEEFLLDALDERGVEVRWDSAVESVDPTEDGVHVETADGHSLETPYLVGADGGSSTVRKSIGVEMSGTESTNTFVIIDVAEVEEDPRPNELHFHYGHPGVGRNVLVAPFAGGWRIDVTCLPSDDPGRFTRDERVREVVAATAGPQYADRVTWVSTYRFKQVTADSFVDEHRRVLLAGDAAHLFAPFGGRGMNSGIHDADAAASAVATAVRAETEAVARREVGNYAGLRETAADWNEYASGKALEHIYSDRLLPNAKKRAAAELARVWKPAGKWLDSAHFGPHSGPPIPTEGKF